MTGSQDVQMMEYDGERGEAAQPVQQLVARTPSRARQYIFIQGIPKADLYHRPAITGQIPQIFAPRSAHAVTSHPMAALSILILTLNEEFNLADCPGSSAWPDNIVVFDSHSPETNPRLGPHLDKKLRYRYGHLHTPWSL